MCKALLCVPMVIERCKTSTHNSHTIEMKIALLILYRLLFQILGMIHPPSFFHCYYCIDQVTCLATKLVYYLVSDFVHTGCMPEIIEFVVLPGDLRAISLMLNRLVTLMDRIHELTLAVQPLSHQAIFRDDLFS